jgi:hypothetical protein
VAGSIQFICYSNKKIYNKIKTIVKSCYQVTQNYKIIIMECMNLGVSYVYAPRHKRCSLFLFQMHTADSFYDGEGEQSEYTAKPHFKYPNIHNIEAIVGSPAIT